MISMKINNISLYGKVDRIIINNDNLLNIIDYKTGTIPSNRSVLVGKEPQLPIIALIIKNSQEFINKNINSLEYWKLSPNKSKSLKTGIDYKEIEAVILKTETFLKELFNFFNDPKNGFIAKKTEIDHEYKNLERIDL
jgi:ATP-dependent helicase/nuclease subunit B